jgi:hypothetical protein
VVQRRFDRSQDAISVSLGAPISSQVHSAQGGEGLGTMWREETAREILEEAGFKSVEVRQLPHDFMNNYCVVTKG